MMTEIVTTFLGLMLGLVTGFYFERRSTRAAERQNDELRAQLRTLEATIYSLGGTVESSHRSDAPSASGQDLVEAVAQRARATQDAEGRVHHRGVVAFFVGRGHAAGNVEDAIQELCQRGQASKEGPWLRIR